MGGCELVLCVKVPLKNAQEVKLFLVEKDLSDNSYRIKKDTESIFFPITKKTGIKTKFRYAEFEEVSGLRQSDEKKNFRDVAKDTLSKAELEILRRAFDIVGSIAILEIPDELRGREKQLAEALLTIQKNVKTVVKKAGIHDTEFRTQPMQYLAGIDTKETFHKEHGIQLKLDIENVYFSPRLSTERKRVADQVKPGESVLVMFSGCAPYPCVISKNTKAKEIVGIELNPIGHKYGLENITLNKIRNVQLFNGDVNVVVPKLNRKFDRIAMPLPKSAGDFLDTALTAAKKGTIIHFYAFEEEGNFEAAEKRVLDACKKNKVECELIRTVKCGQHAPRTFRICVDFRVL